ncbi:MAG: YegS/Rv2252/BmrU family lipid kinase [Patescibacteria group bacterium]|nr:YegS/Rv2252/BmrU family lipid kinase [Patescibacteria group bacterium]
MYYYILNPAAGGGKINKIQTALKDRLTELGIFGEFVKSIDKDDIQKLAKIGIEKGYKTIVAVGGDSTVDEVMNGLLDKKVTLGIIPVGTTNELAKTLGIPDWQSALNILAARKTEIIDLGKVNEKYFITNITIGFDSFITDNEPLKEGNFLTKVKFLNKFYRDTKSLNSIPVTLNFEEGFKVDADCSSITVSSGKFYNLPMAVKPQDNTLDVILVNKLPLKKALGYIIGPSEGKIDYQNFSVFKTKRVDIKTKKPVKVYADGQEIAQTPITAMVADKKLRVIVSKKRKF